jgi:hypothetical protein
MTRINHTDVVFWNPFPPFFCTIYTGTKFEKQAKVHFLWSSNCSFEFPVFLVSVLNDNKCLGVTENCIQVNILILNTNPKNTGNCKKQSKHHKK